jgi:hypothetical protein
MTRHLPLALCVVALGGCQHRGLEKEGPVALTDVPQQTPTMEPARR